MSKKVVTIGGGAGQSRVLAGLKRVKELKDLEVTAIVTAADSGGSSGRLRDEFGVHPWGDILRCIVGLSDAPEDLRELFLYRFPGTGNLGQHTVGNIILTALNQLKGSPLEAVLALCHLLHVREMVLPVTEASVQLCARLEDGTVVRGEHNIDAPKYDPHLRIKEVWLEPQECAPVPGVLLAIATADLIVLGPGDLYTSILPNLLVPGVARAIGQARAKKVFVCNLMTKLGETHGFRTSDFVALIESHLESKLDFVICNTTVPALEVIESYRAEHASPVEVDLEAGPGERQIIAADVLASDIRARHDPSKLGLLLAALL
jgi:uncharacterized cofD-like protein